MGGQGCPEPPERLFGRGGVQAGEQLPGVPQAEDEVRGGGPVLAVVDGSCTSVKPTSAKPAAARVSSATAGSARENGCWPPAGGAGVAAPPVTAWRTAVDHSLRSRSCQTSSTRRPPGRRARPMLVNAATGSAKNIAPNRLMQRSKCAGGNGCTSASNGSASRIRCSPAACPAFVSGCRCIRPPSGRRGARDAVLRSAVRRWRRPGPRGRGGARPGSCPGGRPGSPRRPG
jgi:hypothetical protein